jgi:hypothetical protein
MDSGSRPSGLARNDGSSVFLQHGVRAGKRNLRGNVIDARGLLTSPGAQAELGHPHGGSQPEARSQGVQEYVVALAFNP